MKPFDAAVLRQRVLQTLEQRCGARPGDRILVAVSGGPDSLALLHILIVLRPQFPLELGVAHLHHGLRPEAEEEARFVERQAREWGLPVWVGRADVEQWRREHGGSLEAAARRVRHEFLREVAQQWGARGIALGHTADDRVETLLLNLLRGSGLRGLGALPARSDTLLRPLIECWRWETRAYCQAEGLSPREDVSNWDLRFLRNRLRLEVLPFLERLSPSLKEHLRRLADIAEAEEAFWEQWLEERWPRVCREEGKGWVRLDATRLGGEPPAVQRRLLRWALEKVRGNLEDVEWRHIESMRAIVAQGQGSPAIALPEGYLFRREQGSLYLGPSAPSEPPFPEIPLAWPGTAEVNGWRFHLRLFPCPENWRERLPQGRWRVWLDAERIAGRLSLRSRRPGDRFQPLGFTGSKSLQDFFVDRKVPRSRRDGVPLVVDGGGILWVVGYAIAHRARLREGTQQVLEIEAVPPS